MPTEKPRITFTLDEDTLKAIEDYKFKHRIKNQSQAILSLIEIGMEATLEEIRAKEKAPASEEAGAKENIPLEETNAVLVEMGYIRQGEQLSDADFAFLEHIGGLMDAWFSSKRP